MRRLLLLLIVAGSAACKAEPTPRSFYNHRDPAVVELQESEGEIRTRVINFVAAINRGDTAAALEAMNPAEVAQVMGPTPGDSMPRFGAAGLRDAFAALRAPALSVARTPDLRVSASQTKGWFASHVELLPAGAGQRARLRLSGVFVRDRGDWRLVQIHLVQPPADSVAADSAATDSTQPSPASDEAPAEDE